MSDDEVTLWRCSKCGKWSHAKRRPSAHERWVSEWSSEVPPDEADVIEYDPGTYDHLNGPGYNSGWRVRCGPFGEWRAVRVE